MSECASLPQSTSLVFCLHTRQRCLHPSAVETWKQTQSREGTADQFRFVFSWCSTVISLGYTQSCTEAFVSFWTRTCLHTWNKEKQSVIRCFCIRLINVWRSQRCRRDKRSGPLFGLFALLRLNTMTFKYDISVTSRHFQQIEDVFKHFKCLISHVKSVNKIISLKNILDGKQVSQFVFLVLKQDFFF